MHVPLSLYIRFSVNYYMGFTKNGKADSVLKKNYRKYDIIAPVELLEEPYCNFRVVICNQYYTQIRRQLEEMGIAYDCYYDEYDF